MAKRLTLDVCYDFSYKELGITFHTAQQAKQYQERNREGRILIQNDHVVWIPVPHEMKQIRASAAGFVMCFKSANAASRWCERVVLGALYDMNGRHKTEAYIVREWSDHDLDSKLAREEHQSEATDSIKPDEPGPRFFETEEWVEEELTSLGILPAERVGGQRVGRKQVGFDVRPAERVGRKHRGFGRPAERSR